MRAIGGPLSLVYLMSTGERKCVTLNSIHQI